MKLILSLLCFVLVLSQGFAQGICSGNLGENIFEKGDFGSGQASVLATNPNIAPGYNYTTFTPPDGSYTICSSTGALPGLYGTWINITDNSDDPNGYMMLVNASYDPGVFYEEVVDGLCENTLYEFSADIINVVRAGVANHINPNVSFFIDDEEVYSTGSIAQNETWNQYGFSFVTDATQSSITLTLRNNAPGGSGNDLALDNISFRPCGPSSFIGIESDTTIFLCIDDDPLTLIADVDSGNGDKFAVQWQTSLDGENWEILVGSTEETITHTNFNPGDYYYRYYSAGNEINILNEKCRIISEEIKLTILPDTYEIQDTICEGLEYNFGTQTLLESGSYVEDFESQIGCDSTVFLDLYFIPSKSVAIDVAIADPSCFGYTDGVIDVNSVSGGNGELMYTIFDSEDNVLSNVIPSGNYLVEVVDQYECIERFEYQLIDPDQLMVDLGADTLIKLGDDLMLDPEYSVDFSSISWTGQGEFDCTDCPNPVFLPYFSGLLEVVIQDENGCEASDALRIDLEDQNFVIIPNIFSPNEDNINDHLTLNYYGRSVSEVVSFHVFDRWGGRLYSVENTKIPSGSNLWDGYFGSSIVATGVYFYQLEVALVNGERIEIINSFTVLK